MVMAALFGCVWGVSASAMEPPAPSANKAGYRAGVATKVITPEQPMWMAGYAARNKPAEGKLHDLAAKAICIEDSRGKKLVLVTTDLIGIPRTLGERVAAGAKKRFGLERSDLMLTCSHTHCGPVLSGNLIDMYPLDAKELDRVTTYTAKLEKDLVDLIGAAIEKLEPATLEYGLGKAAFAMNRREPTAKGIINGQNPAGPVDHGVPVLIVRGPDRKPRAIVFGYACHNTTLSFYQWSGDYAGFAQLAVEKAFPGAVAMFWTGCGGDANPQPRGTVELCEQHGKELAGAVGEVVNRGVAKGITGNFDSRYETVKLEIESVPTRAQLAADTLSKTLAVRKRAERLLGELDAAGKITSTYPAYPVQTWALGDQVLWVALGGEVVLDYAMRLKKELPGKRTLWVAGYANDVMAYIPSARVLKEGGYEADSSQIYYGMPGKWSPAIEDVIIEKVVQIASARRELPKPPGPLSPREEQATFKVPEGFKIQLVASEPDIIDPVAMCFDEKGRLFVCEMRGYPNGGVGTGTETRGRIKCLTDTDGDGFFETSHVFAEGLRFPMGLQPYRGGLFVAVAPDLLYLQDTKGVGKADRTRVAYTGFDLANIQQMVNGLQWGLDNKVYGIAGNNGGAVTCPDKPAMPPLILRNRGFRFDPARRGSLEPTSSGGQYGLTADDYQHWFTATNSQHLRQIVLPDHYLRRNPRLSVPTVTIDIPEHGAAARVFRISPFEPWRIERTTRRAGGADAARFSSTELVPGGYITSACSPLIYTASLFPAEYRGNNFVCDPANNLVHRELILDSGAIFTARRAYADREFLASTDTWFRPVHLSIGPDGAIYVLDFYREVIETPLSLPEDIKKQLNLESRGRGRIWRIAPAGFVPSKMPDFSKLTSAELAKQLISDNPWRRNTAQRLLVEKQDKTAITAIREFLGESKSRPGRVNLLYTLQGLGGFEAADLVPAFSDPEPGVREIALRLAEPFLAADPRVGSLAIGLIGDPSPRVRFQLALSAAYLPQREALATLGQLLIQDSTDSWIVTAALSSAATLEPSLIERLRVEPKVPVSLLARLAAMVGAGGERDSIARLLTLIAAGDEKTAARDAALLDGLGQGMRNSAQPLSAWWSNPPAGSKEVLGKLRKRFEAAAAVVRNEKASPAERIEAAGVLAVGPPDLAPSALADTLGPTTPADVQSAAVKALASHADGQVGRFLLRNWKSYSPALRVVVLDAMQARPERLLDLLEAIEKQEIAAADLAPARIQQIRQHPNSAVRTRAAAVLKQSVNADRVKVIESYKPALELKADAVVGKAVFRKHCAACHKLDGFGHDVGPNLLAVLGNKSSDDLLVSLFDPNREVDPRYVTYVVGTADGQTLTGVVTAETPTSITLRRAEGAEDVILRSNLELFRSTSLSLMPVGLEKDLKQQDVADLLAYLRTAGK
jgi:putative membrane-bound dehydrogenase-like protein